MNPFTKERYPQPQPPMEGDFALLHEAIAFYVPHTLVDTSFLGPQGETVPFQACKREEKEIDIFGREVQSIGYVRVGNTVLLDHRFQEVLPSTVMRQFENNIIWLWNFNSAIGEYSHLVHAQLPMHALKTIDLKGKRILDLGAGDGVQGLIAHKLGAAKIYSVESYRQNKPIYDNHIRVNNFPPEVFKFVDGDLADPGRIIDQLKGAQIDIAIANIGPVPEYENAHLHAISLLQYFPTIQTFIGGAYIKGHHYMDSSEALDFLKKRGFSANFRELLSRKIMQTFIVDRDPFPLSFDRESI